MTVGTVKHEAYRISLYHLKHRTFEFFIAEKGEYGSIVVSNITEQKKQEKYSHII